MSMTYSMHGIGNTYKILGRTSEGKTPQVYTGRSLYSGTYKHNMRGQSGYNRLKIRSQYWSLWVRYYVSHSLVSWVTMKFQKTGLIFGGSYLEWSGNVSTLYIWKQGIKNKHQHSVKLSNVWFIIQLFYTTGVIFPTNQIKMLHKKTSLSELCSGIRSALYLTSFP